MPSAVSRQHGYERSATERLPRFGSPQEHAIGEPGIIMFSRSGLDELLAIEVQPAVALYLPAHWAGREIRQDPIRLKNLLATAAERRSAK